MATPAAKDPAIQARQDDLDELRAIGMRLARAIDARVAAEPDAIPDLATAFDRVSRAVRRTVALQQRLDETASADKRAAARRHVIRGVEDTIHQRARTGPEAERLTAELHERLDSPDLEDDIADRPADEIVADICRDLGLGGTPPLPGLPGLPPSPGLNPYKRRTPADIAALCARAAQPPRASGPGPQTQPNPKRHPERFFRTAPTPNTR